MNAAQAWQQLAPVLTPFMHRRAPSAEVAQDLLQQVYLKIHQHLPQLQNTAKLQPWAFQIARNVIADYHRQQQKQQPLGLPLEQHPVPATAAPQVPQAHQELAHCLKPFARQLPEPYRQAVWLTDFQGVPQKQQSQQRNVPYATVKAQVQRGRKKLKQMLHNCCHIETDAYGTVIAYQPKAPKNKC